MIQTIVTPKNAKFDMQVALPDSYVGKKVHVFFYIDEEVQETIAAVLPQKKPSDFFGTLSQDEGDKMQAYVTLA